MSRAIESMSSVEQEGLALVGEAELLKIEDDASFQRAAQLARTVKAFLKRVDEVTKPVIRAAHDAWKAALKQKADLEGQAKEAAEILEGAMAGYSERVEAQRREAELRQQQIREQAEAAARAQQAVTSKAVEKAVEEQALAAALEAEGRGDKAAAERILEQAAATPPPPAPPPPAVFVPPLPMPAQPKAEGIGLRDYWYAEVEDLGLLVKAICEGRAQLSLVVPNQKALDAMARALKAEMRVPGVKPKRERGTSVSA